MKKIVSAFIVLAMVLVMLPMAALAAPATYEIAVGSSQYIDLPGFDMVVLSVTTGDEAVILKVDGNGEWYDWYIDNGMQKFYPDYSGAYELNLDAGQTYQLKLVSDGILDTQTLCVSAKAFVTGTEENPASLTMGENSATTDGISPYFFSWTAEEDGELTISVDTVKCSDWSFQIKTTAFNGVVKVGDTNYSDVEPVVSTETVTVKAGDVCTVNVNTASMAAGSVSFNASFTAKPVGGDEGGSGGEGGSDSEIIGTVVKTETVTLQSETGKTDAQKYKVVDYTANAEGKVYINMSSPDKGWSLIVYKNGEAVTALLTGNDANTFEYPVKPGDKLTFEMGAYDKEISWSAVDGKVTYVISFQAGHVEIEKELYSISDTALYLGENNLTMDQAAENTLFEFVPTETGVYLFTAPAGTQLGNWGIFFNPTDNSGDGKTNTIQWTCTSVGQSVLIGVVGSEDVVIEAERTGDYVPAPVIEWTLYSNKAVLNYFTMGEDWDLQSVDVTDDVADAAVLGADGYYHYGTADGPILLIDLNQYVFPASGYGKVSHIVYDAEGNIVERIDYTDAVVEYYGYTDGGVYPVTEDLIAFYKNFGADQGWYDADKPLGFYLFGEDNVDPETAWMFACYYDENVTAFKSEYYVAGDGALCGSNWVPGDEANQMVMNADGTCSITYDKVPAGKYMFKVTQTDWELDSWGDANGDNYVIELGAETYVTIVFNPETGEISVATGENVETGDHSISGLIVAMMAATAGAVVLGKKKEF